MKRHSNNACGIYACFSHTRASDNLTPSWANSHNADNYLHCALSHDYLFIVA